MSDEQRPIIVPAPELGLAISWHGGSTFRVHRVDDIRWEVGGDIVVAGREHDVFTLYGNENGEPPDVMQAYAKMQDWLDEQREGWA